MANISLEIRMPNPNNWDAHKRRDAIEQMSVLVSERTPPMFLRFLKHLPRDLAQAADANPIEKMFRLSFPYDNNDLVMFANPVVPSGYVDDLMSKPDPMDERVEKSLVFRSVMWVLKKVVGAEMFAEAEKMHKAEATQDRQKYFVNTWDALALALLAENLNEWFVTNNLKGVRFIVHHPEGVRELSMDDIVMASADKKPKP